MIPYNTHLSYYILLKKPITLYGGGHQVLDFTFVDDAAEGIIKVMFSPKADREAFNITYGRGYTLREFAEILKTHIADLEIKIVDEEDVYRPKRGALSIKKAQNLVGYNPVFSLEKGIQRYLDIYRELDVFKR